MIKGFNFSLHFTLDPIQLLTFSQKKATLIQVEKRCVRIFFLVSQKVHLSVVVILRNKYWCKQYL